MSVTDELRHFLSWIVLGAAILFFAGLWPRLGDRRSNFPDTLRIENTRLAAWCRQTRARPFTSFEGGRRDETCSDTSDRNVVGGQTKGAS